MYESWRTSVSCFHHNIYFAYQKLLCVFESPYEELPYISSQTVCLYIYTLDAFVLIIMLIRNRIHYNYINIYRIIRPLKKMFCLALSFFYNTIFFSIMLSWLICLSIHCWKKRSVQVHMFFSSRKRRHHVR